MIFKTKKGKYQLFFLILVRAQGLASPPLRSFAKAHRHTSSAFRLWSNPSSSVLSLMALKTKKTPNRELFCFGTRTGIGFAATALIRQSSPAYFVCLSLVVEPFFQCSLPYGAKNKKKLPNGSFSVLVRAQGLAPPPRRSFAKAHRHTSSAFCLWSNPFSSVLSLMALKTKKLPNGSFFVLVRAQGFEPWTH